jgi:signal peptidase II
VRLTLSYNQNAAFGISLGIGSRWTYVVLAAIALAVLAGLYRSTPAHQRWQIISLGLIAAGALGNVIDRIRSGRGVVDFVDVGIGDIRFWTFNVADSAITIGAIILALTLWTAEEPREQAAEPPGPSDPPTA